MSTPLVIPLISETLSRCRETCRSEAGAAVKTERGRHGRGREKYRYCSWNQTSYGSRLCVASLQVKKFSSCSEFRASQCKIIHVRLIVYAANTNYRFTRGARAKRISRVRSGGAHFFAPTTARAFRVWARRASLPRRNNHICARKRAHFEIRLGVSWHRSACIRRTMHKNVQTAASETT